MSSDQATILLAGGGTGGHIYPNVALAERLRQRAPAVAVRFLVSNRPGDVVIMDPLGEAYTASPAVPLPPARRPWRAVPFALAWRRATAQVRELVREHRVSAVVATGGFVSGPAIVAARRLGLATILVNLDAIPGQANRRLAWLSSKLFSVYRSPLLPGAQTIGLPLRAASVATCTAVQARERLGLDPTRKTLLITGATHGANSIIETMIAWVGDHQRAEKLADWQVFHQCGTFDPDRLNAAYRAAGIRATCVAYAAEMGLVWRSADLAISRAGAGSVAEAWANATPTIFVPNPYHRDQHQRHNAQPLVDAGGARIVDDAIDPRRNVDALAPIMNELMNHAGEREQMHARLRETCPPDGAEKIAEWIIGEGLLENATGGA